MQYIIKLTSKTPPRFAEYWGGSDWMQDIDEAYHYNDRSAAEAELRSIREDESFDPQTHVASIEERE